MDNLARKRYDSKVDEEVKNELEIAKIPVFKLPTYLANEVKTKYIGILNGFVFSRAWTYWVCDGMFPLEYANYIFENYDKELLIRANGGSEYDDPINRSTNPVYEKEIEKLCIRLKNKEFEWDEYLNLAEKIIDDKTLPRYIKTYHIDTQLGLYKFAEYIKDHNITTDMIENSNNM